MFSIEKYHAFMYIIQQRRSFGLDVLELLRLMKEVVCISFGNKPTLIRLLNKVFIALFLSKGNGILLRLELQMGALHVVCRRLPTHQRVLPPVALLQDVPVHTPVVFVPGARLSGRLCGPVDSADTQGKWMCPEDQYSSTENIPDSAGLEIGRSTRQNSSGKSISRLTTIHNTFGDRGELSERQISQ